MCYPKNNFLPITKNLKLIWHKKIVLIYIIQVILRKSFFGRLGELWVRFRTRQRLCLLDPSLLLPTSVTLQIKQYNKNPSSYHHDKLKDFDLLFYELHNWSYKNFYISPSKFTKELLFTISITKTREEREKSLSSRCCFRGHKHPYAVRKQVACSHLRVWCPLPTSSDRLSWQVCPT